MADYKPYTTTGGETWSFIAGEAYGDEFNFKPIVDANPEVAISSLLPPGITLKVPVIKETENTTDTALLPFWKQ